MRSAKLATDSIEEAPFSVRSAKLSDHAWSIIGQARQSYLDALPLAAAIVAMTPDGPILTDTNPLFRTLEGSGSGVVEQMIRERNGIRAVVADFLRDTVALREFDWTDGDAIRGRHFSVRLSRLRPIDGEEQRCLLTLLDRTAEIGAERSLRAEMLHDSLTGLPNRVAFIEAVEGVLEGAPARHAVLVVDLTRFSRVNECMGSIVGDELIITVARRLVGALRGHDMLARIGGDEFGILMRLERGQEDAVNAARRIQAALSTPFRLSDLEIRIDCAIGCAVTTDTIAGSEDLVRNAQLAMKRAKSSGAVEIYVSGEATLARRRFGLETELRRAIDNDQLSLAYQPLVDLQTGAITGYEALARWDHPDRGSIAPTEFIPVAEECGLIVPLGRWALDRAMRTLADWDRRIGRPLPLSVSVNLSAIQLARDEVAAFIESTLALHKLSGDRLTLELTESAIIRDPERATRVLEALKGLRTRIAMDDFGTGYSSLAYLQRLPIDALKIDRTFVTPMLRDRDSLAIVRAVLSLADALGMATTAEGVETMELGQTLGALGCTTGQGWYFSRPLAADAALAYWSALSA